MFTDPIGPLTAADTLQPAYLSWKALTSPPELASFFGTQLWGTPRCITKSPGQLTFTLNTVLDLGFPATLNFNITFTGTVLVPASASSAAIIRFDVDQSIQTTFQIPGGPSVLIETITGKINLWAVGLQKPSAFIATSCSGQPRLFDVVFGSNGPGGTIPPSNPTTDLTIAMAVNGQQRLLTLNLSLMYAHSGEPLIWWSNFVPELPIYNPWWWIGTHWGLVPPPPPPPWMTEFAGTLALAKTADTVSHQLRAGVLELALQQVAIMAATIKREIVKTQRK